jgi:hypothetical protein
MRTHIHAHKRHRDTGMFVTRNKLKIHMRAEQLLLPLCVELNREPRLNAATSSGNLHVVDSPSTSSMLSSSFAIPSSSVHVNPWSRLARLNYIFISHPRLYPGHIHRPDLNGGSSKSCPFTSILLPTNLSGRNSSGACHSAGSLLMVHTLTNTRAPLGMS